MVERPERVRKSLTGLQVEPKRGTRAGRMSAIYRVLYDERGVVPESEGDARLGAKTQVFEDDEHNGAQG